MSLIQIAFKSIFSRKGVIGLLILSIGLSTMLLITIQHIKVSAKNSFRHSISGTDLIVGARTGDIQLLMYTVFHLGNPIATIPWNTVVQIKQLPQVEWVIPISLGDSHRGFSVIGTTSNFFKFYRYGRKQSLSFQSGHKWRAPFDVVIGAEVANTLDYTIGDTIYLSHGTGSSVVHHAHNAFTIQGILSPTGTPIDRSIVTSLSGVDALHSKQGHDNNLTDRSISGCFVGLKSKFSIFAIQRKLIDEFSPPLSAIIPGVTLAKIWNSITPIDHVLFIISMLVIIIAFIGFLSLLLLSLHHRQKELALLRSMGCSPRQIFYLLNLESTIITGLGVSFGVGLTATLSFILNPLLEYNLGIIFAEPLLTVNTGLWVVFMMLFGMIISIIPAFQAYRKSIGEHILDS